MSEMNHLSIVDGAFLHLESPEMPMHVGSVALFDPPAGGAENWYEAVKAHVTSRMHLAPVFMRKLAPMPFDLANPVWIHDDDIDLDYHMRYLVLPKPGTMAQLQALCARLHSSLLDRSRPLWEFYVIEGIETPPDAPPGTRRVAFYSKVHHAALDGAAGVALATAIMDVSPVPRSVRPAPRRHAMSPDNFGIAELASAGIRNTAVQTVKLARTLPGLARGLMRWLRPSADTSELLEEGTAEASRWFGPKTPINVSITNQRVFSSLSLSLAELKHIARGNGVTLNDVVMAICSGALRRYLADLNCRPEQPLLAAVPISLREEGNTDMNTQASMMRISLASNIADPLKRLQAIRKASASAKALMLSMKTVLPTDFPSLGAPWLISGLASLFGRSGLANTMPPLANVAISNVPGPSVALYMAGAKMLTYYPVSIVSHTLALNVTVQSYNGSLDFGLIACRKAMPDLPELARYMEAAHKELLKLTPHQAIENAVAAPVVVTKAPAKEPVREPVKAQTKVRRRSKAAG